MKHHLYTNAFISSPLSKTVAYSHLLIAFGAAAQVLVTYMLFSIPVTFQNNCFILFVFLSTYLQYNMQRGYAMHGSEINTDRDQWLAKHKKIMLYSVAASLIIILFLCNNLSYTSIAIMIGAEVISTLYYLPPFNLRKYGYIKPLIVSAIWTISCATVPLIENQLLTPNRIWFVMAQCCFVAVLCILFDVKDMVDDYVNGIHTYANTLGVSGTKWICVLLIIASGTCFYRVTQHPKALMGEFMVLAITLLSVIMTHDKRHWFYYYVWVDGILIAQALILYLFLL